MNTDGTELHLAFSWNGRINDRGRFVDMVAHRESAMVWLTSTPRTIRLILTTETMSVSSLFTSHSPTMPTLALA